MQAGTGGTLPLWPPWLFRFLSTTDYWLAVILDIKKSVGESLLRRFKGAVTYSPDFSVPSALRGLTSLFGMGRGGTLALWPPYLFLFSVSHLSDRRCKVDHQLEANSLLRAVVCLRPSLTVVLFRSPSPEEERDLTRKLSGN